MAGSGGVAATANARRLPPCLPEGNCHKVEARENRGRNTNEPKVANETRRRRTGRRASSDLFRHFPLVMLPRKTPPLVPFRAPLSRLRELRGVGSLRCAPPPKRATPGRWLKGRGVARRSPFLLLRFCPGGLARPGFGLGRARACGAARTERAGGRHLYHTSLRSHPPAQAAATPPSLPLSI